MKKYIWLFGNILRDIWMGIFRYTPSKIGTFLRMIIWKPFFKKCGKHVIFQQGVIAKWPEKISIGTNTHLNEFCWLEGSGEIEIGDNVWVAPHTVIISFTHDHTLDNHVNDKNKPDEKKLMKTVIEQNVWIGANVSILGGVTIGEGSIVGAGSVVTHDVEPFTVVAGTPARKIKDVDYEHFMGQDR